MGKVTDISEPYKKQIREHTQRLIHLLKRAFQDYENFSISSDDDGKNPLLTITIAAEADYEQRHFLRAPTTKHGLILTIHLKAHLLRRQTRIEDYTLNNEIESRVQRVLKEFAHKHKSITYSS